MNEESINYYAIIPANVRYDPELTPNAKLLYGEITALCNAKGYCWATNSYFAKLYGVSNRAVTNWISSLVERNYIKMEFKYQEGTKKIEERRISIIVSAENNFDTYRKNVPYPIEEKFQPYRKNVPYPMEEKFQENNTYNNTINNTNNNISKTSAEADFEYLWNLYPRKEGKKNALAAYKRAVKAGTTKERVEEGIKKYIDYLINNRIEARYVKKGDTFFRNECWNDDYNVEGVRSSEYNEYGGISAINFNNSNLI